MTVSRKTFLAACVVSLVAVARLLAQDSTGVVEGRIVDSETRAGLSGVAVEVVALRLLATSDETGAFRLVGLPVGRHTLLIRRSGFGVAERPVGILVPGYRRQLREITLSPNAPTTLPELTVEAEAPDRARALSTAGFYDRRESTTGQFVVRADIEKWSPQVTTDVLRHIPGVQVSHNQNYGGQLPLRRSVMGFVLDGTPRGIDTRRFIVRSTRGANASCPPLYFLDGALVGDADNTDVNLFIQSEMIEGIEFYASTAKLPARFNVIGAACGVFLFWTR